MTTNLDSDTLEWAAQWIQDSLKGETNERVIQFGNNMAMTLRAAVQPAASMLTGIRALSDAETDEMNSKIREASSKEELSFCSTAAATTEAQDVGKEDEKEMCGRCHAPRYAHHLNLKTLQYEYSLVSPECERFQP